MDLDKPSKMEIVRHSFFYVCRNVSVSGGREHSVLAGEMGSVYLRQYQQKVTSHTVVQTFKCIIAENVRLEVGRLEQQLLLSYDATEIRGLVEKLVAASPAKPQWRINNKVHY
jgi:hypothetical protein